MFIALDTETERFRPGCMAPPIACVQLLIDDYEPEVWHWRDAEAVLAKVLASALSSGSPIVCANAAYDTIGIMNQWPNLAPVIWDLYDEGLISDVLIRQKLIDIATGCYRGIEINNRFVHYEYTLKALAKRLCAMDIDKNEEVRLTFGELRDLPLDQWPETHLIYAREDARAHMAVWRAQESFLPDLPVNTLHDEPAQCRAGFWLALMSNWGLRTDGPGVEALYETTLAERNRLQEELMRHGLVDAQGRRKIRAAQALMETVMGGIQKCRLTKTGQQKGLYETRYISVDDEACEDSEDLTLIDYSRFNRLGTFLTGHCEKMREGIVLPIHSYFEVLLATGRTSSSSPNVQNVRREKGARECFVPREGHYYLAADIDKAELCTLAEICTLYFGESRLADRLNAGFDPHLDVGAKLLGISYDDIAALYREKDPNAIKARQAGKPANFGFAGGMGARGMRAYAKKQYGIVLSIEEAEALRTAWCQAWPDVVEYLEWIRNQINPQSNTMDVRHVISERYRAACTFCAAANSAFQGLAADATKAVGYQIAKKCYTDENSWLYGCRLVNYVHDEYILEAPYEYAHLAAIELQETIEHGFGAYTPHVTIRATPKLMRRWSKDAESVYDADGHLIPWDPPTTD